MELLVNEIHIEGFRPKPYYDPVTSLESMTSISVENGRVFWNQEWLDVAGVDDLGSDTNVYIIVDIYNPFEGLAGATLKAVSTKPKDHEIWKRLIITLTYETYTPDTDELPTSPSWAGTKIITKWERHQVGDFQEIHRQMRFRPYLDTTDTSKVTIGEGRFNRNGYEFEWPACKTSGTEGFQILSQTGWLYFEIKTSTIANPAIVPESLELKFSASYPKSSDRWHKYIPLCYCLYQSGAVTKIYPVTVQDVNDFIAIPDSFSYDNFSPNHYRKTLQIRSDLYEHNKVWEVFGVHTVAANTKSVAMFSSIEASDGVAQGEMQWLGIDSGMPYTGGSPTLATIKHSGELGLYNSENASDCQIPYLDCRSTATKTLQWGYAVQLDSDPKLLVPVDTYFVGHLASEAPSDYDVTMAITQYTSTFTVLDGRLNINTAESSSSVTCYGSIDWSRVDPDDIEDAHNHEHTNLDFTNSTPGKAGQNSDHDDRYWIKGATYADCYGQSIGNSATSQVIDLTQSSLTVGSQVTLDWNNRYAYDHNNQIVINWESKLLKDSNKNSIDWSARQLYNSSEVSTVDYENGTLYKPVDGLVTAYWFDHKLDCKTYGNTVNWGTCKLAASTHDMLDWYNRKLLYDFWTVDNETDVSLGMSASFIINGGTWIKKSLACGSSTDYLYYDHDATDGRLKIVDATSTIGVTMLNTTTREAFKVSKGSADIAKIVIAADGTSDPNFLYTQNLVTDGNIQFGVDPSSGWTIYYTSSELSFYSKTGARYPLVLQSTGLVDHCTGIAVGGVQVIGARVVNSALGNAPNTGDTNTDNLISAMVSVLTTHGLGAVS